MDTTDYDRIQNIIDRALDPFKAQMSLMMPKDESLSRHSATQERLVNIDQRITKTQTDLGEVVKWAMSEHEKSRAQVNERMDAMEGNADNRFDKLEDKINQVNEGISARRLDTLKYIISVIVSFVLGSGIITLILDSFHLIAR